MMNQRAEYVYQKSSNIEVSVHTHTHTHTHDTFIYVDSYISLSPHSMRRLVVCLYVRLFVCLSVSIHAVNELKRILAADILYPDRQNGIKWHIDISDLTVHRFQYWTTLA